MKAIRENWAIIVLILGYIGMGIAYYIHNEVDGELIKHRVFDSPEEKVTVIDHVKKAPSPAQLQRQLILDSINKITAIEFRKKAIEQMEQQEKRAKYQDSILLLNADQMYQIKEELKKRNSQ